MNHRPLPTCESEYYLPLYTSLKSQVTLIRDTHPSFMAYLKHLLFQTFPNFQVNISIVLSLVNFLHINLQVVNFQRWEHTFGSIKEPEPGPSTSGMSETAAWPQSPIADGPSALPSPTPSLPSSSNFSCLFTLCQSL